MNKSKNQRFLQTDARIRDYVLRELITRPISSVTVREVCDAVGINRSSFYLHYPDIYALMDAICDEKLSELSAQYSEVHSDGAGFNPLTYLELSAAHIYTNQEFYRIYLRDRVERDIEQHLIPIVRDVITPYFRKTAHLSEREAIYHISFYNTGILAIIRQWLGDGCPETPDEIIQVIGRALEMPMKLSQNSSRL